MFLIRLVAIFFNLSSYRRHANLVDVIITLYQIVIFD